MLVVPIHDTIEITIINSKGKYKGSWNMTEIETKEIVVEVDIVM